MSYTRVIDPCVDENTEYCFDSERNSEFKCVCHEGFDGKHCEYQYPTDRMQRK